MKSASLAVLSLLTLSAFAAPSATPPIDPPSSRSMQTDRLLIEWRRPNVHRAKASTLLQKSGNSARFGTPISAQMDVVQLGRSLHGQELLDAISALESEPDVLSVSPDLRRHIQAVPADPLYPEQWYLQSIQPAATKTDQAWDITTGSGSTVVAILDTGVRFEHPDLGRYAQSGKLLDGYDFITNASVANDGNGRDSDASDPGDWVATSDQSKSEFANCDIANSSWHGTRVASLIAAASDDGIGMAGSNWSTLILPVRVMGKCGGYDSDIIAAMRWAAGLPVPGAPFNATPAKVINLSLGGEGACTPAYQSAIDEVTAAGSVVVASAGNEGTAVSVPASCKGVIAVTGIRQVGTKVGYSNLGPGATLAAPAGNCVNTFIDAQHPCEFQIVVARDSGLTSPVSPDYSDRVYNYNVGTSFSAPLVAGAVALMSSVNEQLSPAQFTALLQKTATPFPTSSTTTSTQCHAPMPDEKQDRECICTTQTCGAGMLNTYEAVLAAQRPLAVINAPATLIAGVSVAIDALASVASNQRKIVGYEWSITNASGATPAIANATLPTTSIQVGAGSQFTLRLTVTDDQGAQDVADVNMNSGTVSIASASNGTKSGGGGGTIDMGWLALLASFGYVALMSSVRTRSTISRPS